MPFLSSWHILRPSPDSQSCISFRYFLDCPLRHSSDDLLASAMDICGDLPAAAGPAGARLHSDSLSSMSVMPSKRFVFAMSSM